MKIGKRIKMFREQKAMSLQDVCNILNWPVSKLSKIEREDQGVNLSELKSLSEVLEVTIEQIISSESKSNFINEEIEESDRFSSEIKYIADNYLKESLNEFSNNPLGKLITKKIPKIIVDKANIDSSKYLVSGSVGKGQFAEIPWIAIFQKSITETATKGIYIVYLFTADMKGVYLSLNQGFTFFREKFGAKKGREEIRRVASFLQRSCNTIPKELKLETIDLKANGVLGKGYIPGHITGKYYDVNNIPSSSELADDLRNLMAVYEEIAGIIGNRSVEQFYEYVIANEMGNLFNDSELSDKVEEIFEKGENEVPEEYSGIPKDKKEPVKDGKGADRYPRDPQVAARALSIARYTCENDKEHLTFTRKTNLKSYTEPHHLIPISAYKDFKYSLDVEENICSLCSTCHNCLHYGIDNEREQILKKLYEERKEMLIKVGLEISYEQLKSYYNIK